MFLSFAVILGVWGQIQGVLKHSTGLYLAGSDIRSPIYAPLTRGMLKGNRGQLACSTRAKIFRKRLGSVFIFLIARSDIARLTHVFSSV